MAGGLPASQGDHAPVLDEKGVLLRPYRLYITFRNVIPLGGRDRRARREPPNGTELELIFEENFDIPKPEWGPAQRDGMLVCERGEITVVGLYAGDFVAEYDG